MEDPGIITVHHIKYQGNLLIKEMRQLTCALHEGHETLVLDDLVSTVYGALIPDSLNRGHHHTTTDGVDGVAQQTSADSHR